MMATPKTKLAEALWAGRGVLTAECCPPAAWDSDVVQAAVAPLPESLDAIVVADNPDGVRGSALATAAVLAAAGREPILTMTTRDRNRIALESDVLGAACLGVGGILCVSGDHQSLGVCPEAAGAYDIDSIQFSLAVRRMVAEGLSFDGRELDAAPKFLLCAVVQPYLRPMGLNMIRFRKKITAGARVVFTQAVFDVAGFKEWLGVVDQAGIGEHASIIASVLPLTGAAEARQLQARGTYGPVGDEVIARIEGASDPAAEGVAICAEVAAELKGLESLAGIHILCGGCEGTAAKVIEQAGLTAA